MTLPWAFSNAGLVLGSLIILVCFLMSYYTCYIIINLGKHDDDFTETLFRYFGNIGWNSGILSTIVILTVPLMIYF